MLGIFFSFSLLTSSVEFCSRVQPFLFMVFVTKRFGDLSNLQFELSYHLRSCASLYCCHVVKLPSFLNTVFDVYEIRSGLVRTQMNRQDPPLMTIEERNSARFDISPIFSFPLLASRVDLCANFQPFRFTLMIT